MPTMTNLLRLFRDILSKPRDNNDRDTALHDNLSKVENSSQDRTFTHGYARASYFDKRLEELREEINRLKKIEKELASEYGMNRIECLIDGTHTLEFCSKTYHPSRAKHSHDTIQKDENIIIYFAGHGAAYRAEGINDGMLIADISDRQINTILTQISHAKGRRITLILDCCHAGSVTRAPPGGRVRASRPLQDSDVSLQDMLVAADAELMSKHFPGYRSILSKEWFPDMDSHVALAACEAFQIAIEVKGQGKETGGYFTTHLLAALRSGCLTRETTYRGLLEFIPVSDRQTPVVAGTQMDALLWFQ
ncbi:uncharacterized protein EV420DRAFT_1598753 [Desarmillaria tabescens]|uniref:Peptidase C14 caspase domain-containing protein n=1 Tax=Armillaria tabescens TaxID=1929756 RepID=A0AA39MHE9_ARMTA|nr:uncharacterized protein EV420DRAFT_1598753 [Desarmillaria tabescens]KAK0433819.1 hypothetical protein EV420DRAFT_1598753 [Desarmillaria tabescens]